MTDDLRAYWMMGGITTEPVEKYLYGLLPERDEILSAMEEEAARRKIPIVGPAVGRVFFQLAKLMGARTVFEMGSAIGYSTIWWARAVGAGGRVIYTDGDPKNAESARRNFESAGVADRIEVRVGDALELLSEEKPEAFDIIFNDVDKEDYPKVFRLAVPRVRKGGLFITDNALWSGKVAEDGKGEKTTEAIKEFNGLLYGSKEVFTTVLPLRDGVAVALKL
ncbi:MAG: O-methyltransferase [Acidobacteriota bacterium]|nr:O-methyltransferase [Acidobacteriota bacterium]